MSSLQEIIEKINQTGPIETEEIGAGTVAIIAIAGATILQNIVDYEQKQCVINKIKEWDKLYYISEPNRYSPAEDEIPPAQYETVRPAISMATGVFNKNISLPDIFGHGELIETKDGLLIYLGRIDPNWYQMIVAQGGGLGKTVYIGKQYAQKIAEKAKEQFKRLQNNLIAASGLPGNPTLNLAIAQFGAVSLGPVDEVFKKFKRKYGRSYPWVNPIHMQYCQANTWYGDVASWFMNALNQIFTKNAKAVIIPLYTGRLLRQFRTVDISGWEQDEEHSFGYSAYSRSFVDKLEAISAEIPSTYLSLATKLGNAFTYASLAIPATSIGYSIKTRYGLPYSIYDILKVGIGAPVQSSFWCGDSCSQYGNFAQIVGVGAMSPIIPYNEAAYFALPHPDYGNMEANEIANYWDQILGIGDAIKFSIVASLILSSIYEEMGKKYGDEIADFVWSWTPYTDNQNEAQQTAEEIAGRGIKICERAKEIIRAMPINPNAKDEMLRQVCLCLSVADPYGDLEVEAKKVAECAKEAVGIYVPEEERWYEYEER